MLYTVDREADCAWRDALEKELEERAEAANGLSGPTSPPRPNAAPPPPPERPPRLVAAVWLAFVLLVAIAAWVAWAVVVLLLAIALAAVRAGRWWKRRQAEAPPRSIRRPTRLWAAATALTLVASGAAMARIANFDFSLGFGGPHEPQVPKFLPHQLPYGKGMWIWQPLQSDGGDVSAMISRAKAVGLTHVYVRTGSSWDGFYAGPFLDKILPAAHAAGIRVYGWDFPRLIDVGADVERAMAAISYRTPGGQQIDGFAADIETMSEGTHITPEGASAYGAGLRTDVGAGYPLIACVPRPSEYTKSFYPYAETVSSFDAIAPMVYWLNRQADTDVAGALADLIPFGKPIFPVGQAFDGAPEGGRPGVPSRDELMTFMRVAGVDGAAGVSFWSWQAADQQAWDAIRDAPEFKGNTIPLAPPAPAPPPAPVAPLSPLVLQAG